jgi:hypothetical protein
LHRHFRVAIVMLVVSDTSPAKVGACFESQGSRFNKARGCRKSDSLCGWAHYWTASKLVVENVVSIGLLSGEREACYCRQRLLQYQPPGIWLSYWAENICSNGQTAKADNPQPRRQRYGTGLLFKTGWCSIDSLGLMRGNVFQ